MDSIHSWINEDEVKRLAEGLNSSPDSNKEWTESGYEVEGDPASQSASEAQTEKSQQDIKQVQSQAKSTLANASAIAKASGLTSKPIQHSQTTSDLAAEKVVSAIVTESNLGTFEQVEALYKERCSSQGVCVIDRDGDILYDTLNNAQLTQFSRSIMVDSSLMTVADGKFGSMRIKATAETVLEYISMVSTRGPVVILAKLSKELTTTESVEISYEILKIVNQ